MKTFLVLSFAALLGFRASAQLSVELALDQEQFLPGEAIPLAVKITNRSGERVHFGAEANWLTFSVESVDGYVVIKNSEVPVAGEFDLESSQMGTKHVDLQPYFVMTKPGRYRVTATVRVHEWTAVATSPAKAFDVIHGARLWEQEFGVPAAAGGAPEMRKYALEKANYLREQLRLYVRVTDRAESSVFKVAAISPMVSFNLPEAQVDRTSRLHVLCQSGGQSFTYAVVTPDGAVAQRETYDYITTRPRLHVSEDGEVNVMGGIRRAKPMELPPVKVPGEMPAPAKP